MPVSESPVPAVRLTAQRNRGKMLAHRRGPGQYAIAFPLRSLRPTPTVQRSSATRGVSLMSNNTSHPDPNRPDPSDDPRKKKKPTGEDESEAPLDLSDPEATSAFEPPAPGAGEDATEAAGLSGVI